MVHEALKSLRENRRNELQEKFQPGDVNKRARTLNNLGTLCHIISEVEHAKNYHQRAIEIRK